MTSDEDRGQGRDGASGSGAADREVAAASAGRVRIQRLEGGIADVRLNRPDKMNALDPAMFDAIAAAIDQLAADGSVRVVVLSGAGKAFCAGLDMSRFRGMAQADAGAGSGGDPEAAAAASRAADQLRLGPRTHGPANLPQHVAVGWRSLPVPVIAAVHGVAFGGGFQIALGADIRLVAPQAALSVMELRWGIVPDMGGMALMRRLAPADRIRELTYTARQFSGAEALAYGLATRVCEDPLAEALALAGEIANRNPDAVRAAKRLISLADEAAFDRILQAESDAQIALLGSRNQREAVRANLEKRPPRFVDRD
jgi:enoyl-CoA hydratase/carnithine racemase